MLPSSSSAKRSFANRSLALVNWPPRPGATAKKAGGEVEDKLNGVVTKLVALETRNRDVLNAKRLGWQAELERVNQAVCNLRGVRQTYGGAHSHRWHSYS